MFGGDVKLPRLKRFGFGFYVFLKEIRNRNIKMLSAFDGRHIEPISSAHHENSQIEFGF